jgi:hypothetical protein
MNTDSNSNRFIFILILTLCANTACAQQPSRADIQRLKHKPENAAYAGWLDYLYHKAMLGPTGPFEAGSEEGDKSVPGPFAVTGDLDGDGRQEIVLHYNKLVRIYRSRDAARSKSRHIGTGLNFTLY